MDGKLRYKEKNRIKRLGDSQLEKTTEIYRNIILVVFFVLKVFVLDYVNYNELASNIKNVILDARETTCSCFLLLIRSYLLILDTLICSNSVKQKIEKS